MSLESDYEKLSRQVDRLIKSGERNIGKQYAAVLKDTRHELSDWFAKYSDEDGKLNYADLQKYNRIDKLEKNIQEKIRKGTVPIAREIRDTTKKSLTTAYTGTVNALSNHSGRTIRGVLDDRKIQNIMQNPLSGLKLNDRLSVRRGEVEVKIKETITQGLTRGETYKQMSDRLKDEFQMSAGKANRIIRTEAHRTLETGKYEAAVRAQKQGVKQKKWWMSSFDERTRTSHLWMGHNYAQDNMIPLEEDFVNPETDGSGPTPGEMGTAADDINCRCKMMTELVMVEEEATPVKSSPTYQIADNITNPEEYRRHLSKTYGVSVDDNVKSLQVLRNVDESYVRIGNTLGDDALRILKKDLLDMSMDTYKDLVTGEYAAFEWNRKRIILGGKFKTDKTFAAFEKTYAGQVKKKWFAQGTTYKDTTLHELMHVLDRRSLGESGRRSSGKVLSLLEEQTGQSRGMIMKKVSKYATSDPHEFFAEAMTQYVSSGGKTTNEISRRVYELWSGGN